MANKISKKALISYGMLAMPVAFCSIPVYIYAPDFYATNYKLSLGKLGIILLFLRFIDALQDIIIGSFSDKYSKYRVNIFLYTSIALMITFSLLFYPLTRYYLIWFTIFVFGATSCFSILTINLNALGSIWSKDKVTKTTIVSYRETFTIIGLLLAIIIPNTLQQYYTKEFAFLVTSFLLSILTIFSVGIFLSWFRKETNLKQAKYKNLSNVITGLFKTVKKIKIFLLVYFTNMFAASIPSVLVLFFVRDRLNLEKYTGLFLLVYFGSGILGIPIWQYLGKKISKHHTWLISMFLALVSFVGAFFIKENAFLEYTIICVGSGIALGADLIFPASILSDLIQEHKQEKNSSLFFGTLAFLAKFALAIAAATSLIFLDMVGFVPATKNNQTTLTLLSFTYAGIPCIIKIIAMVLLWKMINKHENWRFIGDNIYATRMDK